MKRLHVRITFTDPILGTGNSNKEIHSEFIASKAPDATSREEEIAAIGVEAAEEKATTVFARHPETGKPMLWNYQIKGFFKEACAMLQRMKGEACAKESLKLKAYKKIIDGCVEPYGDTGYDRKIPLICPEGTEIRINQRPLRGQTAQGERISLAASEELPAGTQAEFYVETADMYVPAVIEWLEYGRKHGISQWRNAGHGRFTYELIETLDT